MKRQVTLTTMGRRSGQPRAVTLYAFDDGENLVIVGSRGGSAKDPAWAANIRDNPVATVRIGREDRGVRAREVEGAERDRLWQLAVRDFSTYTYYESKTKRLIPLFALEPIGDD